MNQNEQNLNNLVNSLHKEIYELKNSYEYRIGKKVSKIRSLKTIVGLKNKIFSTKLPEKDNVQKNIILEQEDYSNLENKKIVVYTCITGDYDNVIEPLYCSKSIDYILFTNNPNTKSEKWKIVFLENEEKLDDILLNRYVKMHPKEFLPDYDYSIYIDGNIKIYSDLSSFINKVNHEYGVSVSKHSTRDKLLDECEACRILKKGNFNKISEQINNYLKEGMPNDYGLLECGVVVTQLDNKKAIKILDTWWNEFINSESFRDQISLPYVLWKEKIKTEEISTLSSNIILDSKIEVIKHKNL